MVTVVIFNLRDVMRNVQTQFKIPHHGLTHANPIIDIDLANLLAWLEAHLLQTYVKDRAGRTKFCGTKRNVVLKKPAGTEQDTEDNEEEENESETDVFERTEVEADDLMQDDEEFVAMADELMGMAEEIVGTELM
ncbi:hypothetical protein B0H17DRAFT_1203520 [Mycena rosella]|uniref:Uncharacterized protein n=1 Tax=Mycena rosella TaxID=1033263 RepID=A0AAD7GC80_MYCRO|nr:hypothetical protein B0H17DRAFT_1203520 [Mycena rosella]